MVDQIRFFAGAARVLEGRSAGEYMAGHTSIIRREPIGVCGQVAPWNYPMMMAVWKFAPAIAAGNAVVLKPSDTTPASTVRMAELIHEAGALPPGVLNVICGDRDTGRALVEHKTPAMVSITGSVRAGMEVAGSAAKDLKRVHLELGGKAPVVIFDDADLEAVAENVAIAGYFNAGQDCTAATRVLAGPGIYNDFVAALTEQAKNVVSTYANGPGDEDALLPPVNNANQLARVASFFDDLPAHASVDTGGQRVGDHGFYFAPTVVSDLRQDDNLIQNEVFGPVITVQQFSDEAEALAWANGVELRPGLLGVDQGLRPGDADGPPARLRLRLDQHAHPAGRRDAARRFQAQRVRQGSVDVRVRGLHAHQARDGEPRQLGPGRTGAMWSGWASAPAHAHPDTAGRAPVRYPAGGVGFVLTPPPSGRPPVATA